MFFIVIKTNIFFVIINEFFSKLGFVETKFGKYNSLSFNKALTIKPWKIINQNMGKIRLILV